MCDRFARAADLTRVYSAVSRHRGVLRPSAIAVVDRCSGQLKGLGRRSHRTPDVDSMLAEARLFQPRIGADHQRTPRTSPDDWSDAVPDQRNLRNGVPLAIGCCGKDAEMCQCILAQPSLLRSKFALGNVGFDPVARPPQYQQSSEDLLVIYAGAVCATGSSSETISPQTRMRRSDPAAAAVSSVVQVLVVSQDHKRVLLHTHSSGPFNGRITGCLKEVQFSLSPSHPAVYSSDTHANKHDPVSDTLSDEHMLVSELDSVSHIHDHSVQHAHRILQELLGVEAGVLLPSVLRSTCAGVFEFLELTDHEAIPPVVEYETVVVVDDSLPPWRDYPRVRDIPRGQDSPCVSEPDTLCDDTHKSSAAHEPSPRGASAAVSGSAERHRLGSNQGTIGNNQLLHNQDDASQASVGISGAEKENSSCFTWHRIDSLPYESMPQDDRYWYELVLKKALGSVRSLEPRIKEASLIRDLDAGCFEKDLQDQLVTQEFAVGGTPAGASDIESGVFVFDGEELQCWHIRTTL